MKRKSATSHHLSTMAPTPKLSTLREYSFGGELHVTNKVANADEAVALLKNLPDKSIIFKCTNGEQVLVSGGPETNFIVTVAAGGAHVRLVNRNFPKDTSIENVNLNGGLIGIEKRFAVGKEELVEVLTKATKRQELSAHTWSN